VLFDAGLTLIRNATAADEVASVVFAEHGVAASRPDLFTAMNAAEAMLQFRWHREDCWASEAQVRELFTSAYCLAFDALPAVRGTPTLARQLAGAVYDAYQDTHHWEAFPDVIPALEALRNEKIHMGIVSDWGHGLDAIVLELELAKYFEFVVISSRLGISKPDPQVFVMALGRIGVAPDDAVYIGDTYVKDVLGARAAGLTPILIDRSGHAPRLDCLRAGHLDEAVRLILGPSKRSPTAPQGDR
jgi:HAD superfamily hydrolase (TIGR01549 family)